ncbi:sulfite exporter TauE/SafE family protein [Dactylosporangium aurantiacum]|uniref:Probable membrane transporter protein n=1 Tax=Dactylosporangium aurantiacum TaxID=35754 RepID=A0A9Q9IG18_9ACTN|nr:sulfite exporter TauE/SafE family protein [Dactylosporangium aurantiacum]MDG6102339.1 sulfite exporter TauE/SafE family protein [Dactylosporangium aurantiacum]UWZ53362.1 sulfite exporter TauE/SafE family protein [Dactylosporangium aurantiacum]
MNLVDIALLSGAGLAAGTVNAIAGGGSLITFPALIATGLSPVAANVTNSVSVFPGYTASVFGSRTDLGDLARDSSRRLLFSVVPTSVVAAALGCLLLLATPARAFELVVPFLVLAAATTLAFQDRLRRLVGHPRDLSPGRRALSLHAMVFLGSLYGGYFGAALGVMLVAALGLVLDQSMARVSALKNVVSAIAGLVTVVAFSAFGPVNWVDVLVVAPTAMVGGYAGARLARRLPSAVLKWLIVAFGTGVGLILLYRALF